MMQPKPELMLTHLELLFNRVPKEYPGGRVEIAVGYPDGKINVAKTFDATDLEGAAKYAEKMSRDGRNVYVGVNPRKPGVSLDGRCKDKDVEIAFYNCADFDDIKSVELFDESKATEPSFKVLTGNKPSRRFHTYYELEEPCRNMSAWETTQTRIIEHFKSDKAIKNSSRLLRLAGSIAYPKKDKVDNEGRVVEFVGLKHCLGTPTPAHDLAVEFPPQAFEVVAPISQKSDPLNLGINAPPPIDDIRSPLKHICADDYCDWVLIGQALWNDYSGSDNALQVWEDWSKTSSKYEDTGHDSCISKWETFSRSSPSQKSVGVGTIIQKAQSGGWIKPDTHAILDDLENVNTEYAVVLLGNRTAILREHLDENGLPATTFLNIEGFKQWMANKVTWIDDKKRPLADIWLKSEHRRQYQGVVFAPEGVDKDYYNLWCGFGVEENSSGSCDLFLSHILENVCSNDEELYSWVIGWFAQMVQHPEEKLGTSLVLRGKQGSGKTIIGTVIGKLFGQHYVQVADPRYITGQFNSHLARCLFLHCDEGFWAGDKGAEGKLKDLVTGDYQLVEYKGKEPIRLRNLVRLLITSNNSWVVPAGFEERRFCVLDVGDSHMQDHAYFEAIFSQLEDGGYEALLHALITFDLTQINLRQVPSTAALTEQKYETMTPVQSWWFERLRDGVVREQDDVWEITVSTKEVVDSYMTHARQMGISRRAAETSLGMQLQQVVPRLSRNKVLCSAWVKVDENWVKEPKRQYAYNLPPLEDCRSFFDDKMGVETDWECGLV